MNIITRKFKKFRELFSKGKYREITKRTLLNMGIDLEKVLRNPIYFMLSRKYRPLISNSYISQTTYKKGGVMKILSGGCGFKVRTTLQKSARHVCDH